MRITFLRPHMFRSCRAAGDALEPLVFAILAGLTPPDVECRLYDERIETIPPDEPTDLVAITAETFTARRAYQWSTHFLRRGVPVVLGGYHPTFCPVEARQYATSVVLGDAEAVWPQVVEDARSGRLRRVYQGGQPSLVDRPLARNLFQGKKYGSVALVQYGRGCRYACDFCSIHAFYGSNLRYRPVDEVVAELATCGRRWVFFADDNLFNRRAPLLELLSAIEPLGLAWGCQASLDLAADRDLVRQMARSGCIAVMIGFESLDADNLRQMKKSWNRQHGSYDDLIAVFRDEGIMVYGGFVLGYDHDTPDVFAQTVDFALRNRLFLANFNPLTPTPGAALYDRLQAQGRLLRRCWWLDPDYRYGEALFQPARMSPAELTAGCYWARTQFYRASSIAQRACDLKANSRSPLRAGAYLLANWASRQEIHAKQGQPLGDPALPLEPYFPALPAAEAACLTGE